MADRCVPCYIRAGRTWGYFCNQHHDAAGGGFRSKREAKAAFEAHANYVWWACQHEIAGLPK